MFLDRLSSSVLQLCEENKLSYEKASERCDLSPRYFGSIARGDTAPTILTLEKLCVGFDRTPNQLLLCTPAELCSTFRIPMPVTHVRCYREHFGLSAYPVCPNCGATMDREYTAFCDRCGQCLSWKDFHKAIIILPGK